jgi:Cu/Ag efflux pump CusA
VPQVQINLKRQAAAAVGLSAGDFAEAVDTAFNGEVVSQVLEAQRAYDSQFIARAAPGFASKAPRCCYY